MGLEIDVVLRGSAVSRADAHISLKWLTVPSICKDDDPLCLNTEGEQENVAED